MTLSTAPNFFNGEVANICPIWQRELGGKKSPPPLLVGDQADRTGVLTQYRVEREHGLAVSGGPRSLLGTSLLSCHSLGCFQCC